MSALATVVRKEFREMARDKRVLYSALIGPVFLVFLFVFLFGFLQRTLRSPQATAIHVVASPGAEEMLAHLEGQRGSQVRTVASLEQGREMVRKGEARVVARFPDDFGQRLARGRSAPVEVVYDPEQPASQIALSALERAVKEFGAERLKDNLRALGLSEELAEPVKLERMPVERDWAFGGILAGLLPYLIVIWAFYGGFGVASDLVAGEKERSTLETLLITPADRRQIAFGKFVALATLCLVSGVSSVATVAVAGALPLDVVRDLFPHGVRMSAEGLVAMILVVLPLAALFAGLLLALSTYARNTRECQAYLTLVSFLVLMPAVFSQFIGYTDYQRAMWVNFVPVLNSANVLRGAIMGDLDWTAVAITVGVCVGLALGALQVVVRLFGREEVLWRV